MLGSTIGVVFSALATYYEWVNAWVIDIFDLGLAKIVVDPKYQGRGVGNLLIGHMLASIDASGLDIYLGTPTYGVRLFEQNGFRTLNKVSCLDGSWHFAIMLREGIRKQGE